MADTERAAWQERSRSWAAGAAAGKSEDDSFNQMLIEAAAIRPGETLLDTGSGTGNPAVSIALAMQGQGRVICSDFTPRMLETARNRARTLSLDMMRFVGCDMTKLPFSDGVFDCVTCRFGLMSVKDKPDALREALRVLRPGGRAAYMVWGPYEENPPFFVPRRAVASFFGEEEGPAPSRHAMSAPGTLVRLLSEAGYVGAAEKALRYRNPVADPQAYVTKGLKRSFADKVEGLAPDRFAALSRALLEAWAPYMEEGMLQVPNYARLGLATKPA